MFVQYEPVKLTTYAPVAEWVTEETPGAMLGKLAVMVQVPAVHGDPGVPTDPADVQLSIAANEPPEVVVSMVGPMIGVPRPTVNEILGHVIVDVPTFQVQPVLANPTPPAPFQYGMSVVVRPVTAADFVTSTAPVVTGPPAGGTLTT